MHLIAPLIAGIRGAENGHAEIFTRGTSTRALYYTGFNGEGASTSDLSLDDNGGAEAYVGQLVDVIVKDSDGGTIRHFVAGAGDDGVEVRSTAFTGTDYVTGASGAGKPVPLGTALDRLKDSFGAVDGKVLFRGSAELLQDVLSHVDLYFNVKAYGAKGDGTTKDTLAIQSAIDDAYDAGGGTVFFPGGTYFIDGITVKDQVNLLGVGGGASIIKWDDPSSVAVEFEDTGGAEAGQPQSMRGLRLEASDTASPKVGLFVSSSLIGLSVDDCDFKPGNGQAFQAGVGCVVRFRNCYFDHSNATTAPCSVSTGTTSFINCVFDVGSTYSQTGTAFLFGSWMEVRSCFFTLSSWSSGTAYVVATDGTLWVQDCTFGDNGGATATCIVADSNATVADLRIYERGNDFGNSTPYDVQVVNESTGVDSQLDLGTRDMRQEAYTASGGGNVDINIRDHGLITVDVTDSNGYTIRDKQFVDDSVTSGVQNAMLKVVFHNTSGGTTGNIEFSSTGFVGEATAGSPFTLAAGERASFLFAGAPVFGSSVTYFHQIGAMVKY